MALSESQSHRSNKTNTGFTENNMSISSQDALRQNKRAIQSLDLIPGIGKKMRERLLDYYSVEETALDAVKQGVIGCVPGITFGQALKLAQACFEQEEQISKEAILKTPDIQEIYEQILKYVAEYFQTEYARNKLRIFFPLPHNKTNLISKRQEYFGRAVSFAKKYRNALEEKNISKILGKLNSFKYAEEMPRIKTRIILTDSQKVYRQLVEEGITQFISAELIELTKIMDSEKIFMDYCKNYDVVMYYGNELKDVPNFPNIVYLSTADLNEIALIPEKMIGMFANNKIQIASIITIALTLKTLKEPDLIPEFLAAIDLNHIRTLKNNATILDEKGDLLPNVDSQYDRYRTIAEHCQKYINETEVQINEEIKREIGSRSIQIQGKQILDLIRSDITLEMVRNYIPPEVDDIIAETIQKGLAQLEMKLEFDKHEKEIVQGLFPEMVEFPIQLNPDVVAQIKKKMSSRLNTYRYSVMVKIAQQLNESHRYLLLLQQKLLEFDFFFGVGQFALEYGLSIPTIRTESGFIGSKMVNLDLYNDYKVQQGNTKRNPKGNEVVPISYHLGSANQPISPTIPSASLALLTGSNSGGKTMCLKTCAQALILAQMGFPTLGILEFSPYDELFFFKKSNGQISAGAFETTLKQFVALAQSNAPKIIFADELESITEPNAASKVLAGIFSLFLTNPLNMGIFVTHIVDLIAQELADEQHALFRIDGIEAEGLDKDLNLIINRNPRFNFIARSTPELILTRLAKSGSEQQQSFFKSILQKFEKK